LDADDTAIDLQDNNLALTLPTPNDTVLGPIMLTMFWELYSLMIQSNINYLKSLNGFLNLLVF